MTDPGMHQNDGILSTGRLRYWDGGPKQAPVILLLHSAFSDAAFSWSPVWEALAARNRVIAPDMPGFGASQAPERMSLATLAGALRELLGQLGVARATVVGNSFRRVRRDQPGQSLSGLCRASGAREWRDASAGFRNSSSAPRRSR